MCPGRYPGVQLVLAMFGLSRLPTSLYVLQFCFYFWSTCTPAWACSGCLSHSLPFPLPHPLIAATHTPGRQVADTLRVVCSCIRVVCSPRVAHCVLGACEETIRESTMAWRQSQTPPCSCSHAHAHAPCPVAEADDCKYLGHSHGLSLVVRLCLWPALPALPHLLHTRSSCCRCRRHQHGLPVYATADISKGSSSRSSLVGARFFFC